MTGKPSRLALAGPALGQARAAADAMYGIPNDNRGVIGSCALRVFGLNAAATGLNERNARKAGIPCDSVYVIPGDKVGIMPGSAPMHFKWCLRSQPEGSWVLRPSEEEMWTNGGCDCSHGFHEWHHPGFKEPGAVLFTSIWHSQRCGKSGGSGG